jgi:hypothetical protein
MVMRFLGSEGASVLKQCSPSLPLSMSSIVKSRLSGHPFPSPATPARKPAYRPWRAQLFGIKDAGFPLPPRARDVV